jgi:hypothetical protein
VLTRKKKTTLGRSQAGVLTNNIHIPRAPSVPREQPVQFICGLVVVVPEKESPGAATRNIARARHGVMPEIEQWFGNPPERFDMACFLPPGFGATPS